MKHPLALSLLLLGASPVLMTQILQGLDPGWSKLLEGVDRAVSTAGFAR